MGVRVHRSVIFIGVLILGSFLIASSPVNANLHDEDETYMDVFKHKMSSLWPFGDRLGYDWTDTQEKVEKIYFKHHENAKSRVDDLREDSTPELDLQNKVADIYAEEMVKAEKEIEALKHGFMHKLTSWMRFRGSEPTYEEKQSWLQKLGWKKEKNFELLPHHLYEDTTSKISNTYKSALESAKRTFNDVGDRVGDFGSKVGDKVGDLGSKVGDLGSKVGDRVSDLGSNIGKTGTKFAKKVGDAGSDAGDSMAKGWKATKNRAAKAYNDAFHRSHHDARSYFHQFRDSVSHGFSGLTKSAARKTFEFVWGILWFFISSFGLMALGGFGTLYLMRLWNKQQLRKQIHANVSGPVVACGEYYMPGDEAAQKKFYDFWSGTGYSYFNRQPGLKKYWVHRGVPGGENNWMSYSEWASIDDLRRACSTTEFGEIKKRSPGYPAKQMHIYQLASSAGGSGAATQGISDKAEGTMGTGTRQRSAGITTS